MPLGRVGMDGVKSRRDRCLALSKPVLEGGKTLLLRMKQKEQEETSSPNCSVQAGDWGENGFKTEEELRGDWGFFHYLST